MTDPATPVSNGGVAELVEELEALSPYLPERGFDTFVAVPETLRDRILTALKREAPDA